MSTHARSVVSSVVAVIAGLVAFFAAGGIAFGAMYVFFFYLWPKPNSWTELVNNINLVLCFLVGAAVGSILGGFVIARVARRGQFIHSTVVIALLYALQWGYILWGPRTLWDVLYGPLPTALGCVPFFALGTWIGSRKRRQVE
jgi:branched-subunit amino acid ABC-type transport system permease component